MYKILHWKLEENLDFLQQNCFLSKYKQKSAFFTKADDKPEEML